MCLHASCHYYNCHVPNMEYEINICALMKLSVVAFRLQLLNWEGFLRSLASIYFVLDVFGCYTVIISPLCIGVAK